MLNIISLSFLSLLPIIGAVCVLFLAMFGHINFKSFNIKKIQISTAILGGIFGLVFFTSMYWLNVEFNIGVSKIHFLLLILMFCLSILLELYTRRLGPNFLQTIGLVLFFGASFFLLA